MAGSDAGFMELFPLPSGKSVPFLGDVIDIVGGQYLINSCLINTLHGYECVGKDLLHMPAVGIQSRVATTGDATLAHSVNIKTASNGFYLFSGKEGHGSEEVILSTTEPVDEMHVILCEEGTTVGTLPDAYKVDVRGQQTMMTEVGPAIGNFWFTDSRVV